MCFDVHTAHIYDAQSVEDREVQIIWINIYWKIIPAESDNILFINFISPVFFIIFLEAFSWELLNGIL